MHSRKVVQLIALTAAVLCQSAGELLITPRNTESKVGETTYLNCSTNHTSSEIFWNHGDNFIYTGNVTGIHEPYRGRFEINIYASTGSYNLVIHSVQPIDAGEYICIDNDGSGPRRKAELIVLDNDPECWSNIQPDGVIGQNIFNIQPDEVQLTCNVTYHGNIPPQMEWTRVGDKGSIEDNVMSYTANNRLIYTMKVIGDSSLDNASYVCQTARSTQIQSQCTSEVIKVLYFIDGNITQLEVVSGGDITCVANNNTFPCISQWYQGDYTCPLSCNKTLKTHVLGEYLCTVKCRIRGIDYSIEAMKAVVVEASTSLPPPESGAIAAWVVVPVAIIILAVLMAVYIVRYRERRGFIKEKLILQDILTKQSDKDNTEPVLLPAPENVRSNRSQQKRPRYKVAEEEVQLLHKITERANIKEKAIRGMTISNGKLFIVREISSNLEVYDCENFKRDPELLDVAQLFDAVDICSYKDNNCLYIMDKKDGRLPKEVIKIDTNSEEVTKRWVTKYNVKGSLSATVHGHVIITVQFKHMLLEYSSDGDFLCDIKLSGDINPWHATKLDDNHYIVCCGTVFDSENKVYLVNKEGAVEKSFGRERGSAVNQLNQPCYLAVAASSGYVMVADLGNDRVLLLDSNLKFKANVIQKSKEKFRCPRRIFLDESFLVVATSAVDPKETKPKSAGNSGEENEEGSPSTEQATEVFPSPPIDENYRLLVFNIQTLRFQQKWPIGPSVSPNRK